MVRVCDSIPLRRNNHRCSQPHRSEVRARHRRAILAFPAIFPASATLIEKHERQKKEKERLQGTQRGREAASIDAAGSAMGSIGLSVFALLVWQFLPRHSTWIVLTAATAAWLSVSLLIWHIRKQA